MCEAAARIVLTWHHTLHPRLPSVALQLTVSGYVKTAFGFSYDDRWYFVLSTFLFAVVYRLLAIIATRCVLEASLFRWLWGVGGGAVVACSWDLPSPVVRVCWGRLCVGELRWGSLAHP